MSIKLGNNEIQDLKLGTTNVQSVYLGSEKVWERQPSVWTGLKFTATQDNSSVGYTIYGSLPDIDINYSLDDGATWQAWDGTAIPLNNGESICVWNKANTLSLYTPDGTTYTDVFKFDINGQVAASGNIMSMVNYSNLSKGCFASLFAMCAITTAPELPATTLAEECYLGMFLSCTQLTTAPELPATTLAAKCYFQMFAGCSLLSNIKILYTGTFGNLTQEFYGWVYGVSSTGTFYYNGSDTTSGTSAIPTGWAIQTF